MFGSPCTKAHLTPKAERKSRGNFAGVVWRREKSTEVGNVVFDISHVQRLSLSNRSMKWLSSILLTARNSEIDGASFSVLPALMRPRLVPYLLIAGTSRKATRATVHYALYAHRFRPGRLFHGDRTQNSGCLRSGSFLPSH